MSYTVEPTTLYYWRCDICGGVSEDLESSDYADREAQEHQDEEHSDGH